MPTVKLYQQKVMMKEGWLPLQAVILGKEACLQEKLPYIKDTFLVRLGETFFYPEGGGQPADWGSLEGIPVVDVFEKKASAVIYHRLQGEERAVELEGKEQVYGLLDWERRLTHMQMHSAEHLLSGLIWDRFKGANKGFHLGKDYGTIDILLPAGEDEKFFLEQLQTSLERRANHIVWENVPLITDFCKTAEEASSHPLRKPLAIEDDITIVSIGGDGTTYDSCACCGTHVPTTGSIGLIRIDRTEQYKGMTRITFKAGIPAYEDATLRHRITRDLCIRHSTEIDKLAERLAIQESKNGAVRKELYDLKNDLLNQEQAALAAALKEPRQPQEPLLVRSYDRYGADDLQTLGRRLDKELDRPLALVANRDRTVLLFSPGQPDCGRLVKDYANMYKGKGGGNAKVARAIFTDPADLQLFIDLLQKHLR